MSDGRVVKLGDVAHLGGGYAFKSNQYTKAGRFVLRTVNIRNDTSITKEGATYISEEEAAQFERFSLKEHDSLFVMVAATLGKVGYVRASDLPALLNQNMWVIRAKDDLIDPVYLHYVFRELSKIPLAWVAGSARSFLRRDDTRNLEFVLPNRFTQKGIAETLKALDDKIELNRRMNETLEAIARAIFTDWFVDFGPTRAKAEGRAPYLATELWDLFPDSLDDESKPEDWGKGALADVADSPRRGVSPADVAEDTPYIGLAHMPRRSIALSEWDGAGNVTSNKSVFKEGEFLFGKLRPYFHKVGFAPLDGICSTDIVVVIPRASDWAAFTLACLSSDEFVGYTDQTSTGTKMPRTSWKAMGEYKMCLPPEQIARAFQSLAQPLIKRVSANIHESRTLSQTRDLLLPRLISGEIRLAKAEKAMKAVA